MSSLFEIRWERIKFFLSIDFVLFFAISTLPAQQMEWMRTYGGTGDDVAYYVQQTADSGFIVTGFTQSFGAGDKDVYLLRLDANGDTLWTRTYGAFTEDLAYSIALSSDGGFLIAGSTYLSARGEEVYLIKTNANGDTLWTKTYGTSADDRAYSIKNTSDGGYIIGGYAGKTGLFTGDIYLLKINGDGDTLWTKTIGGGEPQAEVARSVTETFDGGYFIAGNYSTSLNEAFLLKTDSLGDILWTRRFGGSDGVWISDGQQSFDSKYISLGGEAIPFSILQIRKFDQAGNLIGLKNGSVLTSTHGYSIQQTIDSGFVITGTTHDWPVGNPEVFIVKTNESGDWLWSNIFGELGIDRGWSVIQTFDGGYLIAGETTSFGAGGFDVYLIKVSMITSVESERLPSNAENFQLYQNFPNPFNPTTTIQYKIPTAAKVSLKIHNILGQVIRTLVNEALPAGIYQRKWDGLDERGRQVSGGIYLCRLIINSVQEEQRFVQSRKMICLR